MDVAIQIFDEASRTRAKVPFRTHAEIIIKPKRHMFGGSLLAPGCDVSRKNATGIKKPEQGSKSQERIQKNRSHFP